MELKKSSLSNRFLYWFLMRVSWYDMPKSLCSYFWATLISFICLPFSIIGRLIIQRLDSGQQSWSENNWANINLVSILTTTVFAMLSMGFIVFGERYWSNCSEDCKFYYEHWYELIGFFFTGLIIVVLGIALIFLLYSLFSKEGFIREEVKPYVLSKIYKGRDPHTISEEKLPLLIKWYRAIKAKVCPIIYYKDDERTI